MPSPFPGMDPYLEEPGIWPDFHHGLAAELKNSLNQTLPSPFYARVEARSEMGVVEEPNTRRWIVPDVLVLREHRRVSNPESTAILDRPRSVLSNSFEYVVEIDPIEHPYVEIRDARRGHQLITLIEILSPSNKLPGSDRDAYLRKQAEVLASDASLIEIDLLRAGKRTLSEMDLEALAGQIKPPVNYLVLVNRAWRRKQRVAPYEIFPCTLREWLPCFPVPLTEGMGELPLDLQYIFNRVYDAGAYRRGAIDYSLPPVPPLSDEDAAWADRLLRDLASRES